MGMASARGRTLPRTTLLSSATRTHFVPRALVVLRAAIAVATAAALTAFVSSRLSRPLDVTTDVVGYPIAFNFNVNRYLWVYGLWVAFFPVAALGIDLALARLARGRLPQADWNLELPPSEPPEPGAGPVAAAIRTAFVGAVLGLEIAIAASLDGPGFLLAGLVVLGVYGVVAMTMAAGLGNPNLTIWDRLATVNVYAAPLTILGLSGVSEATEIKVLDSGTVYEYPWFPLPLAVVLTAALLAVAFWGARRAGGLPQLRTLERRFLLLVLAPILLFLLLARLPGEIGPIDFFHEGEPLAAGQLTADGLVPWRDLMAIHGLLHDVITPWLGFSVFEGSRWGYYAGVLMLVVPAYWISQYFLFVYLFGRNVLFLLGTQVAVVLGLNRDVHTRFALVPFALLLLAAVLRKPTWPRASALAVVLAAQAVISPETSILIPACLSVLGLFELYSYDRALSLLANFRRTLRTVTAGALALGVLVVVFATLRILDDFVFFYRTFFSDHTLTGGIPLTWLDDRFYFAGIAPVALVILTFWFFATARRARRQPAINDWVMAALALTVLLYYPKFLGRADAHVYQVFAAAIPLLAYAVYRVLTLVEGYTWRGPIRHWPTALAVLVVVALSPLPVLDTAEAVPDRVSAEAHFDPVPPYLGFLSPNATDLKMIRDVRRVLDAYLEPGDDVFDFSNNPMLFHYALDRRPSTRYFHVSMAIRKHTQADLVEQLERRRPKLVVFSSSTIFGLPMWDGVTNQVRHYDVSEYILDHYRPLFSTHGFLLMARNDASLRPRPQLVSQLYELPVTDQLYFRTLPCDWGYAPNFLSTGPRAAETAKAVELSFRPTHGVATVTGWATDLEATRPALEVVAARGSRVVGHATPSNERPDIAGGLQNPRFLRSGFSMLLPGSVPLKGLRFYALTRSGTARELIYGPDSGLAPSSRTPPRITFEQRRFRVIPGGIHGWAESVIPEKGTLELELPSGTSTRDYDWLEIRTRAAFLEDTIGVTDNRGDPRRTISFKTLDRGQKSVRVQVGACSQWQGLPKGPLYLESVRRQEISEVRLIP